jgi:hypothetical protein
MASLRRAALLVSAVAVLAAAFTVLDPSPSEAKANIACSIGIAPGTAVTGALGIGNPVGDACEAITDPVLGLLPDPLDPLNDAVNAIGEGIFDQIASWASDGAVWLLGEVAKLTERTTSPHLLSKGFLRQYRQMALIGALMAALMCLFAVVESVGRGDGGMLWRVFLVNVPLAAIATSAAYVVVQLLIGVTDGLSEAVTQTTSADTAHFFKGSIEALGKVGAGAGAVAGTSANGPGVGTATGAGAGAVAVPLFVGFIASIVVAFAAFFVWIELLMRDAAIYVVALFMPLGIAASIWPRWASALRRTCELVIVVVFSKFVIVAIIALAASLLAHSGGEIEQVLAAGAMLLLACFAPFVLFKLVPFAEGAMSAAYNRSGAAGGAVQALHTASSVQMMRHAAHANWAMDAKRGGGTSAAGGGGSGNGGGGGSSASKGRPGGSGGGGGGASASEAAGASGGAGSAVALPVVAGTSAAKAGKAGGERLAASGTGQAASEGGSQPASERSEAKQAGGSQERTPRPSADGGSPPPTSAGNGAGASAEPTDARGGDSPTSAKPPRPSGDVGAAEKKTAGKEGKA